MMKPELEAALKALMDMSGKAIRMRVLKTDIPQEKTPEITEAEVQDAPSEHSKPITTEALSDEDLEMVEEALEQMGGH